MNTFFTGTVFDSSLAILAIIVPLGLAHVILLLQSRNLDHERSKESATTRDETKQERTELSEAEKKQATRLMMYWLF
jgi:hypothetical protein